MLVGLDMCVTHHLLYFPRMSSLRWCVEVGVVSSVMWKCCRRHHVLFHHVNFVLEAMALCVDTAFWTSGGCWTADVGCVACQLGTKIYIEF